MKERLLAVWLVASMAFIMMPETVSATGLDVQKVITAEEEGGTGGAVGECETESEIDSQTENRVSSGKRLLQDVRAFDSKIENPISDAEGLLELLSSKGTTSGKTYTLTDNITVDTSDLATDFLASGSSRVFNGVLDGNGKIITVQAHAEGQPAMPLFDNITGSSGARAKIQNLTVEFQGDVQGSTIAGVISYTDFENLTIIVNGDILFSDMIAVTGGKARMATGLFLYANNGISSNVKNIKITCKNIGENAAQGEDARYVMAAGVYTELTYAGGQIVLDGIEVQAENIYAEANPSGYIASYNYEGDVTSAGMGYSIGVKYNNTTFNVADVGESYVKVGGDIKAVSNGGTLGSGYYSSNVKVSGIGITVDPRYTWNNVSVDANSIKAIANDDRNAYAVGFCISAV